MTINCVCDFMGECYVWSYQFKWNLKPTGHDIAVNKWKPKIGSPFEFSIFGSVWERFTDFENTAVFES